MAGLLDRLTRKGTILQNMDGKLPRTSLRNAGDPPSINDTFSKGQYVDYVLGVDTRDRARDIGGKFGNTP